MIKRRIAVVVGIAVLALSIGGVFGRLFAQRGATLMQSLQLFGRVVDIVISNYVEKVDADKLIKDGIRGMLQSLDPYTEYLEAQDYDDLKVRTEGRFGGIGIHIGLVDGQLTVISPIEGTPAERAGIRGGDRIAQIEGKSTDGFTTEDAVKVLRGAPGSKVKVSIARPSVRELMPFELTREIINIKAVPYAAMLEDSIGYVRLADFSRTATTELRAAIDSLFGVGAVRLVFDLRSNGGGLLTEGRDVSDIFLPKGRLIVQTKGRMPDSDHDYTSETDADHGDFPLVVLVDRGSASAAEIVAGAIQDWDRGVILGDTSFGKGSVQTIHQLGPQMAVKVTTAYWYTPSGRCINMRHDRNGEVVKDSANKARPAYHTVGKLHRTVYGGGAILPDVYVPYERLSGFSARISRDAFFNFAVDYAGSHSGLDPALEVDKPVVDQFEQYLRDTKKMEFTEAEFDSSREFVAGQIEREIAGKLIGMRGEYQVRMRRDPQASRAVELLKGTRTSDQVFKKLR